MAQNPFDQFDKASSAPNPFDQFDKAPSTPNPFDQFDTPSPQAPPPETSSIPRRIADYGITALKSTIAVPEAAVGLLDIPTLGYAGKAAEALGFRPKEAREFLEGYLSPEQQYA